MKRLALGITLAVAAPPARRASSRPSTRPRSRRGSSAPATAASSMPDAQLSLIASHQDGVISTSYGCGVNDGQRLTGASAGMTATHVDP